MTPQEKATELFNRFKYIGSASDQYGSQNFLEIKDVKEICISHAHEAKQAIRDLEIQLSLKGVDVNSYIHHTSKQISFWLEVEKEIQKL